MTARPFGTARPGVFGIETGSAVHPCSTSVVPGLVCPLVRVVRAFTWIIHEDFTLWRGTAESRALSKPAVFSYRNRWI